MKHHRRAYHHHCLPLAGEFTIIGVVYLGGVSMGEVLYMEAWGDAAAQVSSLLERGKVYRVQGARIMPQMPRFSTSRLDYYLRAGHIRVA